MNPNQLGRSPFPAHASQWMLVGLRGTVAATGYSLNGPEGGETGVPSSNFTVQLTGGTTVPLPVTITPSDSGGGGTFTPSTVVLNTGSTSATFTYTPVSSGVKTISTTNNRGLPNPSSLGYIATAGVHLLNTLISYWKLDDTGGSGSTWNDSNGTNHLTDHAGVGSVASVAGKINTSAQFVSANDQTLRRVNNSSLQVTSDFTFSLWVKLIAQTGSFLVSKYEVAVTANPDYNLQYTAGGGFEFSVNGSSGTGVAKTGGATSNGVWTHIVTWYDSGTGQLYLRINDTTTYQSTTAPALVQTTVGFGIGGSYTGGLAPDAVIDEVGFWKRKLTLVEITSLYNSGSGLAYSSFTA
jgi:hypothetical protein